MLYANGDAVVSANDLGLGVSRYYTTPSSGLQPQGLGDCWQLADKPYVTEADGQTVVVLGPQQAYWFTASGGSFTADFGAKETLYDDATKQVFDFTLPDGTVYRFGDFSYSDVRRGQFVSMTGTDGEIVTTQLNADYSIAEIDHQMSSTSAVYQAEVFSYVSSGQPNAGQVASIELEALVYKAAPWPYLGLVKSLEPVRQVTYTYYDGVSDTADGMLGDLNTATEQFLGAGGWTGNETYYYRYYTTADGSASAHHLKMALTPQEYYDAAAVLGLDPTNPDTTRIAVNGAGDFALASYAENFFSYNSSGQVSQSVIDGLRTYLYSYTASTAAPDYNNWATKAIETNPDGSTTQTVFTNCLGETLLTDLADTSGHHWLSYDKYGTTADCDEGQLMLSANPSAIEGYDSSQANLGVSLYPSAGILDEYAYAATTTAGETSAGDVAGYLLEETLHEGTAEHDRRAGGELPVLRPHRRCRHGRRQRRGHGLSDGLHHRLPRGRRQWGHYHELRLYLVLRHGASPGGDDLPADRDARPKRPQYAVDDEGRVRPERQPHLGRGCQRAVHLPCLRSGHGAGDGDHCRRFQRPAAERLGIA